MTHDIHQWEHLPFPKSLKDFRAGCTLEQVHLQGSQDAVGTIRRMIENAAKPDNQYGPIRGVRILGTPKVTAIIADREVV